MGLIRDGQSNDGGGGGQKSQKIDDVFYKRPLRKKYKVKVHWNLFYKL